MIKPKKYYVHAYQTKIECAKYDLRSLNSRKIARNFKNRCGNYYCSQLIDLRNKNTRAERIAKKSEKLFWEDNLLLHQRTGRNKLKKDIGPLHRNVKNRPNQNRHRPTDNRAQIWRQPKKSSSQWVHQREWRK